MKAIKRFMPNFTAVSVITERKYEPNNNRYHRR